MAQCLEKKEDAKERAYVGEKRFGRRPIVGKTPSAIPRSHIGLRPATFASCGHEKSTLPSRASVEALRKPMEKHAEGKRANDGTPRLTRCFSIRSFSGFYRSNLVTPSVGGTAALPQRAPIIANNARAAPF